MESRTAAAIILLAVSLIVAILGYRIDARRQISLIAGLDVAQVRDRDGLAQWVGRGLQVIGATELLIGVALFVSPFPPTPLICAYVAVSLLGAAVLLLRMKRYLV